MRPRLKVHDRPETISNFIRDYGVWQRPLVAFLANFLRDGDVFVDVGANIGYFSVYAALCVGPSGIVHAIEPAEENATLLAANIALNSLYNVRIHRVAVSDHEAEAVLFRSSLNAGAHSLLQTRGLSRGAKVPVRTLDQLLQGERAPRLIKIDVQGADFDVLNGMIPLLSAWEARPAIVMEFCPSELVRRNQLDDFLSFVTSHRYSLRAFIANERSSVVPPQIRRATLRQIAQDFVKVEDTAEFDVLLLPRPTAKTAVSPTR